MTDPDTPEFKNAFKQGYELAWENVAMMLQDGDLDRLERFSKALGGDHIDVERWRDWWTTR